MTAVDTTFGGVGEPAVNAVVLTKNDSTDLVNVSRALYVGGTGDLNVVMLGGETCLFSAVPAGSILPIRITRLLSTGTTATLVVALR